ncbi:telomerase RNA component interacting RNase-like [Ischnura elegans]|uniref:telomerase RNA component interacting RNase-like n=1 Tax=Ischnura elegans TaxID=197161 RepID=UPI001ED89E30|nr:telomerase RNA component interacting RNase-like [Ischnura elegans]
MAESDSESSCSSSGSGSDANAGVKAQSENEPRNVFKNDGSFLKMFQLLQKTMDVPAVQTPTTEASLPKSSTSPPPSPTPPPSSSHYSSQSSASEKEAARKKSLMSFVGKRRGGKVLPTGVVKKQRKDDPVKESGCPKDAWSQYMEEVRKYKELSCEEEGKTRPLVK